MDSLLPTGFILVVLSLSWLLLQSACLYLMFRFIPQKSGSAAVAAPLADVQTMLRPTTLQFHHNQH